ncbi:MAG: LuxR C-terminal-related transcriptional regulator, partial [bacterium]
LETKFYIPRRGSALVSRPRLIERIREGATHKLTIISAPAGFGKTTLLAEWLADSTAGEGVAAWVSLDPTENDPALFWAYAIRALQKVHPEVGRHALSLLHAPQPPPAESVLTGLINDINAVDCDFILILDDYHVIDAAPVHSALSFLLDHLPRRMHVVLASRSDPPLPLPRLRARGELTELRPADLRFTFDEASAFLNQVMGLDLSAIDTATLEQRTEGWIAGLKLAAVSMKARGDTRGFVDAFSGDNRYIADYLVEEVLQREPERIRNFLLATAILDRLSGPLCDAVTGEQGSQVLLDGLERRNLFLVALDDQREWYRYHHLFAEVLQAHLIREDPDRIRTFHVRASAWYELQGSPEDAVRHAIAAEDMERAANLLEMKWPAMDRSYQSRRWLGRVKALPDAVVRVRPVLSMGYAWGLLNAGELEAAEIRLRDVERWLDAAGDTKKKSGAATQMVVVDEARFRTLTAELLPARLYLAGALGDTPGTIAHAKRALDLVPEGQHAKRATATALVALAQWASGALESAHETFGEALACMTIGGAPLDAIRGMFILGDIRMAQGRLHEAAGAYDRGLRRAMEHASAALAETDELHLGLSEVDRERGDVEGAMTRLLTLTDSVARAEQVGNRQRWCTAMARVRDARGDLDGAFELLVEAESVDVRSPVPRVRPIAAMKARVRIAQGRLADAAGWVSERGLSVDDDLNYMREFEHITLARMLIARHAGDGDDRSLHDAVKLLVRLATAAEMGGRTGSVIETLVLQALAHQALGNTRAARDPLERALALAEPEGYLRVFMDEGNRMRDLLRQAVTRGIASGYARRVMSAFDEPPPAHVITDRIAAAGSGALLTARELVILRLIAAGMRNQEIARHLSISPATVKRHIANTYGKLDVRHRTEALVRANELKLL